MRARSKNQKFTVLTKGRLQKKIKKSWNFPWAPIRQNDKYFGKNIVGGKKQETLQNGLKHEEKKKKNLFTKL